MDGAETLISARYRLVRIIAAGGMGVVWEGWDELLERAVAVKQLRTQPGVPDDEAEVAKNRAMREARIAARLHHPNAVPVFDAVEQDGQPCLVMQYVPSTPLSAVLAADGPLPPREAARIGAQVASALAAAHRLGIVHRDVKPGNVLLGDDGRALISDFGISRALGDSTLTSTGLVHGTPAYLAPEVARGDESTFASDVFSLGSTLYAVVEGAPPFGADANSIAVLHRVAMGEFTPPRHAGALAPLLLEMLTAEPARRPPMHDVAARLDGLAGTAESSPTTRPLPGIDTEPDATGAWDEDEARPTAVLPAAPADPDPTGEGDPQPAPAVAVAPATGPEPVAGPAPATGPEPVVEPVTAAGPEPVVEPVTAAGPEPVVESVTATRPEPAPVAAAGPVVEEGPVVEPAPAVTPEPDGEWTPEPEAPAPADEEPRRRRWAPAVIGALVVLVLAALVATGLLLATRHPAAAHSAAPPPSSAASPAPTAVTPTPTPTSTTPRPTPTPSSTPRATSTSSRPAPHRPPTSAELVRAIRSYFALLPGDTAAAWRRLTPSFQQGHAQGRAYFDSFWSRYRSVTASGITGQAPDSASATLTYVAQDGTRTVERDRFRLVRQDGMLKIDAERTG